MAIERIGIEWPRQVDVEGFSDEYAEIAPLKRLPFDTHDPLIFHVLTTVDDHAELLDIMRAGGSLMPASWADGKWGDKTSMIFARDRIAGDDEYLFTTPCNVFSEHHERARYHPAVAFRLSYVDMVANQIAFRVHDLEPLYKMAEQLVSPDALGMDDDEWEELSPEELQDRYEEDIASIVEEQLRAIAECGTQYDSAAAVDLTKLYAQLVGSFRQRDGMWVPKDDPKRLYIFESAQMLFPDCILESDYSWAEEMFVDRQVAELKESWDHLFGAPDHPLPGFPARLLTSPASLRPELLVQGSLVLCEAAFYRDDRGAWRPVPAEVCEEGRRR